MATLGAILERKKKNIMGLLNWRRRRGGRRGKQEGKGEGQREGEEIEVISS